MDNILKTELTCINKQLMDNSLLVKNPFYELKTFNNNLMFNTLNNNKNTSIVSNILFSVSNVLHSNNNEAANNRIRLLIVDDDERMLETLKEIFEQLEYKVDTASNGKIAIELTKKENFQVVLMDIKMPEVDGVEALKEIMKKGASAKVIMMTAFTSDKLEKEAITEGAKKVFHKPINIPELNSFIKSL